jgi:S-adenosylmethionine hydrolase
VEYRFAGKPGNCGVLVHASTPRALYGMFPKSIEAQLMHENAGDFWCIAQDITVPDMETRRGPRENWGVDGKKQRRIPNLTDGSEKPAGEWNTMVIECVADRIKVWVNHDLVNYGYDCQATRGQIALQAEGSEVEFRKVELTPITALSDRPAAPEAKVRNAVVIQADFGGAVMPGVVFAVDHDIPIFTVQPLIELYNIDAAARSLSYTAPVWPAGTVFVSVVDPGVGTKRKSVVLKTKNGQYFVSPDNGTLSLVATELGIEAVREIEEKVNRRAGTEWSHTFHGRDVYSYTAGRLAAGVITYEQVGPLLEPKVVTLDYPKPVIEHGTATGMIDTSRGHLGNTTCLIDRHTFGDVPVGRNLMFINSSGYVSMAVNQGNFANTYNINSGRDWTLSVRQK